LNAFASLSYVFVVTFTPGPNNIMSMANAGKYGYKRTMVFITGMCTGFLMVMILSSYFNLLLYNLIPKVKTFMGLAGAGYIIYLSIRIMRSKDDINNKINDGNRNNLNLYFSGMIMQFINPKVILYGITVISNFIIPYYKSNTALILFSVFLSLTAVISNLTWALFGSLLERVLSKYRKPFNIAMGLLLIYSAISISGIINLF
jgi:cysteine/O-acetylserine efflux protein